MKGRTLKEDRKGFTLIELVVVIAILAILAAVAYPVYNGYIDYTHKGTDRATVGEIIHAIDLANYDDPGLFENGATVYITEDGVKSGNTEIDAALERALGDLSAVKLSSGKWTLANIGDFPALKDLGKAGSSLDGYFDEVETTGKKAVFADDVGGLWDAVVKSKEDFGANKDNYLQLAIKYLKEKEEHVDKAGNSTDGIDMWNSGGSMTLGAEQAQAISLARNYCFAAYAAKQNLSPEMKEELQKFVDEGYGKYGAAQPTSSDMFFWQYFEGDNEDEWETIVANYNSQQASIDSKAYMAMMEAVEAVGGAEAKDDELMKTMEKYVGVVAAGIGSRDALTYALNIDGEYATINVTKQAEKILVNPLDLDPREKDEDSGENDDAGGGVCELEHNTTLTVQTGRVPPNLNFGALSEITICSIQSEYATCTFNVKTDGLTITKCEVISGAEFVTTSLTGITAKAKGDATVKITATDSSNKEYYSTIIVHVH